MTWLLLVACATIHLPEPSDALAAIAHTRAPEATLETLGEGRALVLQKCSGCHAPPDPMESLSTDWADIYATMQRKAKLTGDEVELVEVYLQAWAELPPETVSPGAR